MKTLLMTLLGYSAGVLIGLTVECTPYFRANPSNLRGLVALVVHNPVTTLIGLVAGFYLGRPKFA